MPLAPGPVQIVPGFFEAFGHSYFNTTVGTLYQTGRIDAIVRAALDIEHMSWRNRAVTGAQVTNQGRAQGGYARMMQETTKSTRTSPYAANGGAALLCWGINDIGISGNSTQMQTAFKHAMRTMISLWRASSIKQCTDTSIVYGAGFTQATGTQDFTMGTSVFATPATVNANQTITITIPSDYTGETIAVCFIGASGVFGGAGAWTGTASFASGAPALSTSNIMPSTVASHCPVIQRFKGTTADAGKTLIFTSTSIDTSGQIDFNGWWMESQNPPPVIVCNIPRLLTAGYAGYATWSASQATADTDVANFNAQTTALLTEFDSMVQIANFDAAMNKDLTNPAGITTLYATDGVHPNEYGAARCTDAIVAAVQNLRPPGGLGQSAYMQVDAPQSSAVRRPRLSGNIYLPEASNWVATGYTFVVGDFFAMPVVISEGRERWIGFQMEVTNAPTTGATFRWGIYDDVGWTGYPQDLVVEATVGGAFAVLTGAAIRTSPASGAGQLNQPLDPGLYWIGFKVEAIAATAPIARGITGPCPLLPSAWVTGTAPQQMAWKLAGQAVGVMPSTYPTGAASSQGVSAAAGIPAVGFKIF
jgi:hypothetical protein